ncbi:MAG: hypothetical protein AAFZ04_14440, partial [Pseudomonadota bacterium]
MQHPRHVRRLAGMCGLAALVAAGPGQAVSPPSVSEDVINLTYGFYCDPGSHLEREAPGTITGTISVPDIIPQFSAPGQAGPASLGIGFGVKAEISARLQGTVTIL